MESPDCNNKMIEIIGYNQNILININNTKFTKYATLTKGNFSESLTTDNSQGKSGGFYRQ